jgi:hypothetical protein
MQCSEPIESSAGVYVGGSDSFEVDLYEMSNDGDQRLPLWEQDEESVPNAKLAMANLKQPHWHDIARVRLPASVVASTI